MPTLVPSDIYPAVRHFLTECGFVKALKGFDKELAAAGELAETPSKKAKLLSDLELVAACQVWLDSRTEGKQQAGQEAGAAEGAGADGAELPKGKKRKHQDAEEVAASPKVQPAADPAKEKKKAKKQREQVEAEEEAQEEAQEETAEVAEPAEEAEERPKKKKKHSHDAAVTPEKPQKVEETTPAETQEAEEGAPNKKGKKKDKAAKEEKKPGTPFQRIDSSKWLKTIKDERLLDNTHKAKDKFGVSAGDSWGDKAAVDLLKVKGKGFRKEMAKKKRASWRGGGEIDQGVNSIKFEDSSEEE